MGQETDRQICVVSIILWTLCQFVVEEGAEEKLPVYWSVYITLICGHKLWGVTRNEIRAASGQNECSLQGCWTLL